MIEAARRRPGPDRSIAYGSSAFCPSATRWNPRVCTQVRSWGSAHENHKRGGAMAKPDLLPGLADKHGTHVRLLPASPGSGSGWA